MSSLRNAVKRREHKERSQPESRKKFGLLEKKKDYRERADDYNKKQKHVKRLRGKAADRNPDEFYFAMQNASTKEGAHVARKTESNKYTQEELALMRTQDIGYLRSKAQCESRKEDRLQETLHFIGVVKPERHDVFVDDEEEAEAFDAAKHFATPAPLLTRSFNRPRTQLPPEQAPPEMGGSKHDRCSRRVHAQYQELAVRQKRATHVKRAVHAMELKQALAGKGGKRKISPTESGLEQPVYKWRRQRKK